MNSNLFIISWFLAIFFKTIVAQDDAEKYTRQQKRLLFTLYNILYNTALKSGRLIGGLASRDYFLSINTKQFA